jgi:pyridoxine kinase
MVFSIISISPTLQQSGLPINATPRLAGKAQTGPTVREPISVLAISSSVTAGHVGLSAIVPTLNFCGYETVALPTVVFSNHPGFPSVSGTRVNPETLGQMLDALDANAMLANVHTILSGYLPSAEHAAFVETAIDRVRKQNPNARYICDPILGDHPKGLYIDHEAANAIRERLVPRADILLPNCFELAWLSDRTVNTPSDAVSAARSLGPSRVVAKSVPVSSRALGIVDIHQKTAELYTVDLLDGVPNGTGDMFSALVTANRSLECATASLKIVIEASLNEDHLQIIANEPAWNGTATVSGTPLK